MRERFFTWSTQALWSLWASHYEKTMELLKHVKRKAMKLLNGLDNKTYEEWLEKLGLFPLEKAESFIAL